MLVEEGEFQMIDTCLNIAVLIGHDLGFPIYSAYYGLYDSQTSDNLGWQDIHLTH